MDKAEVGQPVEIRCKSRSDSVLTGAEGRNVFNFPSGGQQRFPCRKRTTLVEKKF